MEAMKLLQLKAGWQVQLPTFIGVSYTFILACSAVPDFHSHLHCIQPQSILMSRIQCVSTSARVCGGYLTSSCLTLVRCYLDHLGWHQSAKARFVPLPSSSSMLPQKTCHSRHISCSLRLVCCCRSLGGRHRIGNQAAAQSSKQ